MCITFLVESKMMVCLILYSFLLNKLRVSITHLGGIILVFCFRGRHAPYSCTCFLGTGAVYSFDPVGSYEREACRAAGAAQSLVQPFLDNQVALLSLYLSRTPDFSPRSLYSLIDLLQKPTTCTRHFASFTLTTPNCPLYSDRFFH